MRSIMGGETREHMELEKLRQELASRNEQLAQRDSTIHELCRKLRPLEDLQRALDSRTNQLAEKEREVSELKRTIARRNRRLAKMKPPAGEMR